MSHTLASDARRTPRASDKAQVALALREALRHNRNVDGGWAYSAGKRSRLEPTCWALLALAAADGLPVDVERVRSWPRHDGWLVDVAGVPPNQPFNALGALTLLQEPSAAPLAQSIVSNLLAAKGERYPQDKYSTQDNSLQAWSWVKGTASWVEPTAWSLLLLKKLRSKGWLPREAGERIHVGDQLLLDRVCSVGGWNYGNAQVFGHDLWPYVPTTALALLALRDHPDLPAVTRSLEQMQSDLRTERSALAVALALVCLNVYGRIPGAAGARAANGLLESSKAIADDLVRLGSRDLETPRENVLGQAIALYALSEPSRAPEIFSL